MLKKRQSILSTIFTLFTNFSYFVFEFLFMFLLINNFGANFNGFIKISSTIISFIAGSADGGIGVLTVIFLIKPILNKDYSYANNILYSAKKLYLKVFFILSSLVFLLILVWGVLYFGFDFKIYVVKEYQANVDIKPTSSILHFWELTLILFSISASNLISFVLTAPYENLLQSDQNNYFNNIVLFCSKLILYTFIFLFLIKDFPIWIVFLTYFIYSIFKSIFIYTYSKIRYKWINTKNCKFERKIFQKKSYITLYNIGKSILYKSDLIIAGIFLGISYTSFLSIFYIIINLFRTTATGFSASFKEYFAISASKKGRVPWYSYINFEKYNLVVAVLFSFLQFLIAPFLFVALFQYIMIGDIYSTIKPFINTILLSPTFIIISTLQTFFYLLIQPHEIMLYSKNYFYRVANLSFIIHLLSIISSILISTVLVLFKALPTTILYSFESLYLLCIILQLVYLYYFTWSKLTYNSNFKNIIPNSIFTIFSFIGLISFKFIVSSFSWDIFLDSSQSFNNFKFYNLLQILSISFFYVSFSTLFFLLIVSPKLGTNLIKTWFIFTIKKKIKSDKSNLKKDIFMNNFNDVYIKKTNNKNLINFRNKINYHNKEEKIKKNQTNSNNNKENDSSQVKEVYILKG